MACTLSLGLTASCSLSRPPLSSSARFQGPLAAPTLRAHAHRVQAVAGLSRGLESAAGLLGHSLNAPSDEELSCPVTLVSEPVDKPLTLTLPRGPLPSHTRAPEEHPGGWLNRTEGPAWFAVVLPPLAPP